MTYPHQLLDDVKTLASFEGWSEEVYLDFFKMQRGDMTAADFGKKYHQEHAILALDMTGYTTSTIQHGELHGFMRIMDAQRVVIPVLQEFGAQLIRCFADDIVALFHEPNAAIDAAFEVHHRISLFNASPIASYDPTQCCAGIGYGQIYAIGPNLAQGDEMNQAAKLGEDIARANETLITERTYAAMAHRDDIRFECQDQDDRLFSYYRATQVE